MELNRFSLPVAAAIMMINASLLVQGCLEEERTALLHIQTSMFDPRPHHLDFGNFGDYEFPSIPIQYPGGKYGYPSSGGCCGLPGVSCDNITGRVNGIVLYNVRGFEKLARLNKLESLDLGLNNFNNSILSSLKGLSSLKHLYLDSNQLKGSIDTKDFDSLSKLEELDLSRNEIQNFVTST
ncbi:RECEPTOR-LIKE PROTEIN KINASE, partial [Salix purpurea]